ncbi:MAG: iron-containing alcohol dehydrogenase, partial [Eubacterium sp.]|nr:iron-containing alcohol dehydrogenase [Eubacterium sp.]
MKYNNQIFLDEFKNKMLEINPQKVLFVCSKDYDRYGYRKALDEINIKSVSFTSFEPCPEVSSVENGIEAYKANGCDFVVAVGGGSAIDTAKGIKFYSKLDFDILAVPTTAGTGAEVTRFSVLYRNKDKESVSDYSIIPNFQIFDYTTLKS